MRDFASAWPEPEIVQRLLPNLPWGQNVVLLDKLRDPQTRLWYASQCVEHGWSRSILALQIEKRLHERQGKVQSNFALTLPPADSDMAAEVLEDPYLFDFLGTADPRREREVEQALVDHIQRFPKCLVRFTLAPEPAVGTAQLTPGAIAPLVDSE